MSSRATQGLQILLIISIMLNVVLGVTTYLYNKQAFEKTNAAKSAEDRKNEAVKEKTVVEEKFDRAKKLIGYPSDVDIDKLEENNKADQQAAGFASKESEGDQKQANVMGYKDMVAQLAKIRDERTADLAKLNDRCNTLEITFKNREAAKDGAIAKTDEGYKLERERIQKIEEGDKSHAAEMAQNEARVVGQVKGVQERATKDVNTAQRIAEAASKDAENARKEIKPLVDIIRKNDRKTPDPPSGEITWVSLSTKTVWINRGRADSLQKGIRFTVYSAESNTAAKAVEKGTVEVTRIRDEHQAECRIVDDKFADPMTVGDKVFTAFWSPGQQVHFALNGIMNLDGDGRNQVNEAIGLVKSYGGAVDCWLDEQGHHQGAITASTQYIVNGDPPSAASAETSKNYGAISAESKRYGLHDWSLADFKQRTNYQKTSSVENFGAGAATSNAAAPAAPKAAPKAKAPAAKAEDEFK